MTYDLIQKDKDFLLSLQEPHPCTTVFANCPYKSCRCHDLEYYSTCVVVRHYYKYSNNKDIRVIPTFAYPSLSSIDVRTL